MIPGPQESLIILVGMSYFGVIVWLVGRALGNENLSWLVRLVWVGVVILVPVIGAISYYFSEHRVSSKL